MNPLVWIVMMILPVAAFFIGVRMNQNRTHDPKLSKAQMEELVRSRELIRELDLKASEHMAYGDTYATIASGLIHDHRQTVRKELS
jgi:hypothetical protein